MCGRGAAAEAERAHRPLDPCIGWPSERLLIRRHMPVPNRAGGCTGTAPAVSARTRPRGAAMSLVPFRLPQSVARRGRPLAVLAASLVLVGASSVSAAAHPAGSPGQAPTVVLVHGAFADASSWSGVVELLQREGHTVVAPAIPLRGIASDAAYVA